MFIIPVYISSTALVYRRYLLFTIRWLLPDFIVFRLHTAPNSLWCADVQLNKKLLSHLLTQFATAHRRLDAAAGLSTQRADDRV